MMYSTLPDPQRRHVLMALTAFWLLTAAAGTSSIIFEPNRITGSMGPATTDVWGAVVLLSGVIAAGGVAFKRYRLEWVAAWTAAAGVSPYVFAIWWLVIDGEINRFTQAFFMSSLLVAYIKRALSCAAHAAKMRELHEEVQRLDDLSPRTPDADERPT